MTYQINQNHPLAKGLVYASFDVYATLVFLLPQKHLITLQESVKIYGYVHKMTGRTSQMDF